MLISFRVLHGEKALRNYGLIDVDNEATMLDVYEMLKVKGRVITGDDFVIAEELWNRNMTLKVSRGTGFLDVSQTVPLASKLNAVVEFGRYFTFALHGESESHREMPVVDAFVRMREGQLKKVWPKFYNITRPNRRHELHNSIIRWLQERHLGWSQSCDSLGESFVKSLGDALWY